MEVEVRIGQVWGCSEPGVADFVITGFRECIDHVYASRSGPTEKLMEMPLDGFLPGSGYMLVKTSSDDTDGYLVTALAPTGYIAVRL